jgi:hypothetical protein
MRAGGKPAFLFEEGMRQKTNRRDSSLKRTNSFATSLLALLVFWLSGCRVVEETAKLPVTAVTAVVPGTKSMPVDPAMLQTELQRYADDFIGRVSAALDEYVARIGTPEARSQALVWRLSVDSSVLSIVSGPNPTANLLDFVAIATLMRVFLEEQQTNTIARSALQPWLVTSLSLETNAWKLAEQILNPTHQRQLRNAIAQWHRNNADVRFSFFARPQEFAAVIRQTREKEGTAGANVFSMVGLDPTVGLDPAVREVTRSRLFAERAMFIVQRMPYLVRWHIELLADQLLREEQVGAALTTADRLSRAAEAATQTAAQLPDRITAERKAVLEALETQEGKLRELSAEVGRTLAAGEKMSASLNTTLTTFDALMKRFGVGEASSTPPTAPDTNSPPFSILDYAQTADRIAVMAQQVDVLLKDAGSTLDSPALEKRLADLNKFSERARSDARSVLNHAFLLAAGLILLALVCAIIYRRVTGRSPANHE